MKPTRKVLLPFAALTVAMSLAVAGCEEEGPAERAGETVDEAIEDAGEAMEDAGDKVEDAAK